MTVEPDQDVGGGAAPAVTQTASGHNIIQQVGSGVARIFDVDVNVSLLGGLVVGVPVVILAGVVAYVSLRLPPLEALEGPGLKVAVPALAGPDQAGQRVGAFLAEALRQDLPAEDFTVAGPARVRETPADAAEADRLAETLLADVVIHGHVSEAAGSEAAVLVDPRVLVVSQGTRDSLPFVLDHGWGAPFAVVPETLSSVGSEAVTPLRSLVSFIGAVGALATDSFELATERIEETRRAVGALADPRLVATVETMAGWIELRRASATMDAAPLPAARTHFDAALDVDADAELARVGHGGASYLEAIGESGGPTTDAATRDRLSAIARELDTVAADAADPYARVMAEALAAQALLAAAEGAGAPLSGVRDRLASLLESLPDREQRAWGVFESFIHEKLGFIAASEGDLAGAIDHYTAAVERASPYWSAFYLAAVGRLEVDRDGFCEAAAAFASAAATVQVASATDAATYRRWGAEAERRCVPG